MTKLINIYYRNEDNFDFVGFLKGSQDSTLPVTTRTTGSDQCRNLQGLQMLTPFPGAHEFFKEHKCLNKIGTETERENRSKWMFGRQSNCQLHTCQPNSGRKEGMKEGGGREEGAKEGEREEERHSKMTTFQTVCVHLPPYTHSALKSYF